MLMDDVIWIIIGMAAVTYIPRLLPFLMLDEKQLPQRVNAFLKCIPLAAIGALIFPGVLQATPGKPLAAISGMLFALFFGFWRGGIVVPVLGAVILSFFVLSFI